MLTIIKPRGDIKSNWESTNPTLRMREWGIEWETTVGVGEVKIKIGDGVTPWLTLDYVLVNDVTKKIVKTFAEVTVENPELAAGSSMDMLWAVAKKKFDFLNTAVVKINGDIDGLNTSLTNVKENGDIDLTEVDVPSFTDYATDDTTIPDARTAISNITSSIKVPAFISNAKAALRGLVTLGEMRSLLVNSGMTTETGKYFLDAAYGKTLADQISQLNSHYQSLASKVDIKRLQSIPTPVRQEYYIFLCEKELDWLPHWSMGIYISNGFDSVMMWIDVAGGTRIHSAIYNGGSKVWQHD